MQLNEGYRNRTIQANGCHPQFFYVAKVVNPGGGDRARSDDRIDIIKVEAARVMTR